MSSVSDHRLSAVRPNLDRLSVLVFPSWALSMSGVQESLSLVEVLMSDLPTHRLTALPLLYYRSRAEYAGAVKQTCTSLVTTQPKSCSGSHKGTSGRRHWIAMDEKVQQRDVWASVYVDNCDVNNNSFCSPVALNVWEVTANPHFLQTKHNAKREGMSFILKICLIQQITFLSILGDCTQLGYLAALTICGDCRPILRPDLWCSVVAVAIYSNSELRLGLLCIYRLD